MFSDKCEAGRCFGDGDIIYYIDNDRCTREEFHRYRAKEGLTDFIGTEFSLPSATYNRITIGHWSSFIDYIVSEYFRLVDYSIDDDLTNYCLRQDCRDKFMTIDQQNYLYYRGQEESYIKKCPQKFLSCKQCKMMPEDIRTCIDIDQRQFYDDAYNKAAMREFGGELYGRDESKNW